MNAEMETPEKIYCCSGGGNPLMTAALMNNGGFGGQWNNPFIYLLWIYLMRWMNNGEWGGNGGPENFNSRQIAALQETVNTNHNNDLTIQAIQGNASAIHELANNLNMNYNTISQAICGIKGAIDQVGGEVGFTGEKVINAIERGNNGLASQIADCCCSTKNLIQSMGYENRLGQKDMINAVQQGQANISFATQQGFDRTNTGLERGFSSVAYENQRQTCDIINAVNAAQQRTMDALNSHWKDELAQALQDEKFKNSQLQQNIYFRDLYERGNGCCN